MATTAGTLIDSIARRVRDANNTAHSRALVRDLLDRVQVTVNARQEYILTETTITATPGQALYNVETDLGSSITVTEVSIAGRDLDQTTWENLHRISTTYLTDQGSTTGFWAKIGRSLIVLYPAPNYPVDITFTASKRTTELNDDDIPLELRAEDEDILRELTTALLLVRQRDLDMVPHIVGRVQAKLGFQQEEQMMRDDVE